MVSILSVPAAQEALAWARRTGVPTLILGGGSNVVVSDDGFDGLVLHVALRGISRSGSGDEVTVQAGAGEDWDELVAATVRWNLAGLECLSGIPGRVGATPIQNVGAYGQAVSESLVAVDTIDRTDGRRQVLTEDECGFGYRTSRFKEEPDRWLVLGATYRLQRGGGPTVAYQDLVERLERDQIGRPGLAEVRSAVLAIRRAKGMVLDPDDPDTRSDGSFFLNPLLEPQAHAELVARVGARLGPDVEPPGFLTGRGFKASAAWLIEQAGFTKGHQRGKAALSSKHALAITNRGGASAAEIVELMREIQNGVEAAFGLRLEPEPRLVGF